MSNTQEAPQADDRGRRRRPRLVPGRRDDLTRFNTFWWVLLWVSVIVLAVLPIPWW